jgi:hypothetical protein
MWRSVKYLGGCGQIGVASVLALLMAISWLLICGRMASGEMNGAERSKEIYIIVRRDGAISRIADLADKKMCYGPEDAPFHGDVVLRAARLFGRVSTNRCLTIEEAHRRMLGREIDAYMFVASTPIGHVQGVLESGRARIVAFSLELIERMEKGDSGQYRERILTRNDYDALGTVAVLLASFPVVLVGQPIRTETECQRFHGRWAPDLRDRSVGAGFEYGTCLFH